MLVNGSESGLKIVLKLMILILILIGALLVIDGSMKRCFGVLGFGGWKWELYVTGNEFFEIGESGRWFGGFGRVFLAF